MSTFKFIQKARQLYQPIQASAIFPRSRSLAGRSSTCTYWNALCIIAQRIVYSPLPSLLTTFLVLGNIVFLWHVNMRVEFKKHYCPDLPFSPDVTGIQFETKVMNLSGFNRFGGTPGQVMEHAWNNLLSKQIFRASKEEMIQFGEYDENSIELENGGYVAGLRVFGELRCMDWFKRQYGNPEIYARSNFTEHDRDHCINVLLKGVMCRADVTLSSWSLEEENGHRPLINRDHAEHVCVDWYSVLRWLEYRKIAPAERVRTDRGLLSQEEMMLRVKAH